MGTLVLGLGRSFPALSDAGSTGLKT